MGYIYKITNLINNKIYIGQTNITIEERFKQHIYNSFNHKQNKDEYDYPVHRAIRKYGKENFTIEILEECPQEQLNEKEREYIMQFNSYNLGYNATLGGDGQSKYNYDVIVNFFLQNDNSLLKTCQHFHIYDQVVYSALKSKNIDYKKLTSKQIKNKHNKKILCVETGQIFNTITEIDKFFNKQVHGNIRRCLNGVTEKAYGYHWEEIEDE